MLVFHIGLSNFNSLGWMTSSNKECDKAVIVLTVYFKKLAQIEVKKHTQKNLIS